MSALTTLFNHLYVYVLMVFQFFTGSSIKFNLLNEEQMAIVSFATETFNSMFPDMANQDNTRPILLLIIGIFACGSVIGLVRRLIR